MTFDEWFDGHHDMVAFHLTRAMRGCPVEDEATREEVRCVLHGILSYAIFLRTPFASGIDKAAAQSVGVDLQIALDRAETFFASISRNPPPAGQHRGNFGPGNDVLLRKIDDLDGIDEPTQWLDSLHACLRLAVAIRASTTSWGHFFSRLAGNSGDGP